MATNSQFTALFIILNTIIVTKANPIDSEIIPELKYNQIENSAATNEQNSDELIIDLSHLSELVFTKPNNETGLEVEKFNASTSPMNPEELGTYLEGDMLIPKRLGRNGLIAQTYRWPNGIIPYVVEGSFNEDELLKLRDGLNEYHAKTCIKFIPRTTENDYIAISNEKSGCWSSIGRIGGRQQINLQTPGCLERGSGTFVHELMHVVGFIHEQNREERDNFVTIVFDNINKKSVGNFDKTTQGSTSDFGVPYDYNSIMHYSPYAFSVNGKPTIISKFPAENMGQRISFSTFDIQKINAMYKCNGTNQQELIAVLKPENNHGSGTSVTGSFLNLLGFCKFLKC